jgi:3-oxoacyl-[acyl-carrier-protein] synthase-1
MIIGNDSTVQASATVARRTLEAGYTGALGYGAIFQVMGSTATMNLSTLLGTRGANWTVAAACASGAHALGQAHTLIGSGQQEIVIAGGTQELSWESMTAFDALRAFSTRIADPQGASRPFAKDRDGLVPSGGAAVLVVESYEHARARGARIYAEICAYAFSSNGNHLTAPTVEGPVYCMRKALADAKLKPADIDYVNAHAASTPIGDLQEGRSILEVFGRDGAPVSSTKSMTGHECWMSGASEVIYSVLMMRDGFLAGNRNLSEIDPELAGLNVIPEAVNQSPRLVLSNSFGFGGTNSVLILKAYS